MQIVINFILAINVIVSLLIILLVLMQRPKNEGLGAAFGGGMTENLFGAQTSNVLQTITRWLGGIFFALTLLVSWLMVKKDFTRNPLHQRLSLPTVIPATPAPVIPSDVPITLPGGASTPELEKSIQKMIQDAAKGTTPAPEGAKPAPAPEATNSAPAPDAAKPVPAPEVPKPESTAPAPAPEASKPAPAPEAAKPAPAPGAEKPAEAPAPGTTPEVPKP